MKNWIGFTGYPSNHFSATFSGCRLNGWLSWLKAAIFKLTSWWLSDWKNLTSDGSSNTKLYEKRANHGDLPSFQSLNHQEGNLKIAAINQDNHLFNLHPGKVSEKWFEGYPVKSTQIFMGCHLIFFSYHLPGSLDLICIHKIFSRFLNKWKTH